MYRTLCVGPITGPAFIIQKSKGVSQGGSAAEILGAVLGASYVARLVGRIGALLCASGFCREDRFCLCHSWRRCPPRSRDRLFAPSRLASFEHISKYLFFRLHICATNCQKLWFGIFDFRRAVVRAVIVSPGCSLAGAGASLRSLWRIRTCFVSLLEQTTAHIACGAHARVSVSLFCLLTAATSTRTITRTTSGRRGERGRYPRVPCTLWSFSSCCELLDTNAHTTSRYPRVPYTL